MTRPVFGPDFHEWLELNSLQALHDGVMSMPPEQRPPLLAPVVAAYVAWQVRQPFGSTRPVRNQAGRLDA